MGRGTQQWYNLCYLALCTCTIPHVTMISSVVALVFFCGRPLAVLILVAALVTPDCSGEPAQWSLGGVWGLNAA